MPSEPSDTGTPAPPKRRRIPKGEARKLEIIRAAMVIFSRDGYAGASIANVAKVAGMSPVGLLHHFPSKLALLRSVLEHRDQYIAERFKEVDRVASLAGFIDFLRFIMKFSIEDAAASQALMIINAESLSVTHPAHQWYRERFGIVHGHIQAHLKLLIEASEIRADTDVKQMSIEVASMMDGLQIQWLRSAADVPIEEAFDKFLQRLARDLAVKVEAIS